VVIIWNRCSIGLPAREATAEARTMLAAVLRLKLSVPMPQPTTNTLAGISACINDTVSARVAWLPVPTARLEKAQP